MFNLAKKSRRRTKAPAPRTGIAFQTTILSQLARAGISETKNFGSNPGALRMFVHAPPRLRSGQPLVVVLHGCGQDAASFAADAGWIALAERFRFALLLPEQTYENNHGRCFTWYNPEDVRRGGGEAMSIRQMISRAVNRFGSDPRRIFIAGFSAGAAMTAAMLAAYPAVFAAGAAVAGMPVGCARSPLAAMMRMRRAERWRGPAGLADEVRAATRATSRKKWPRLTIWQGERDRTVAPGNAAVLAAQWTALHGLDADPTGEDSPAPGVRRATWSRHGKAPTVELWSLADVGHGFPVDARTPGSGRAGPWVVDAGLFGARHMIAFWGLDQGQA